MNISERIQNTIKISQKLNVGIHALIVALSFNVYFMLIKHLDYRATELFEIFSNSYELLYIGIGFTIYCLVYNSFIVPLISELIIIPIAAFARKHHPNKAKLQLKNLEKII